MPLYKCRCCPSEELTEHDLREIERFRRFLRGERSHEIVAWALGEPMSSKNDPDSSGMGC